MIFCAVLGYNLQRYFKFISTLSSVISCCYYNSVLTYIFLQLLHLILNMPSDIFCLQYKISSLQLFDLLTWSTQNILDFLIWTFPFICTSKKTPKNVTRITLFAEVGNKSLKTFDGKRRIAYQMCNLNISNAGISDIQLLQSY